MLAVVPDILYSVVQTNTAPATNIRPLRDCVNGITGLDADRIRDA